MSEYWQDLEYVRMVAMEDLSTFEERLWWFAEKWGEPPSIPSSGEVQ